MTKFKEVFSSQSTKPIVGIDIGSYYIKCAESEIGEDKNLLKSFAIGRTPEGAVNSSGITKPELVGQAVLRLLSDKKIQTKKISFSLPSSAVFVKKITVSQAALLNLDTNIYFEASNYIPHRMDAVSIDYQILDASTQDVSVLLVAVKNDILNAYKKVFEGIGLEPAIADVESFSLGNLSELLRPEYKNQTYLIIDIGHRHTTLSIFDKGIFVSSSDISVGGKNYTEALLDSLKLSADEVETIKMGIRDSGFDQEVFSNTLKEVNERVCAEILRQIEYLKTSGGAYGEITKCIVTGGASLVSGLKEMLSTKLENIKISYDELLIDNFLLKENNAIYEEAKIKSNCLANVLSLSQRRLGDKKKAEKLKMTKK